ncbi:N-acetyltransferase family protein [Nocardia sp. R16R-3T]
MGIDDGRFLTLPSNISTVRFRHIANPGAHLSIPLQERMYAALVRVTTDSFAADMSGYWLGQYMRGYFERLTLFCFIEDEDGRIVGWSSAQRLDFGNYSAVYLDSTGTAQEYQGKGIITAWLHSNEFEQLFASPSAGQQQSYIVARTENPVMHRVLERLYKVDVVHPRPVVNTPADVSLAASGAAGWLGQGDRFDPGSLKITNAYDTVDELYGDFPSSGDAELDSFYRRNLGPLDAYLICGKWS